MFSNLKMHFLNSNDVVVYNDVVIGLFNNYRITSNSGVHLKEDRKLTENEMDRFIEKIDSSDIKEETGIDPNELKEMLNTIVKYHPEIKYIVHGFNEVLAAPRRIEKKKEKMAEQKAAKEKRKAEQRKPRHLRPDPETKPDDKSEPDEPEQKTDTADSEKEKQEAEQRQKEAEEKRLAEEQKFKKEREEKQNTEKDSPGKYENVGKPKFDGFLGLMFKMFQGLADPKKKADKEELRKKLRNEYSTYKKNKKWLEENNELINMLSEQVDKKQISLDSISIINEIISRDPTILEEINLQSSGPITKKVPLVKLTEELKDLKLEPDDSDMDQEEKIKDIFKRHKIDVNEVVIDRDVNNKKIAEIELGGLDSLMKLIDILSLDRNDLK